MSTVREHAAPGPRSLLIMLGVYAGLTIVVALGSTLAGALARAPTRTTPVSGEAGAEVLAFLGPLGRGAAFEAWVIDRVEGPRAGGLPLRLRGPSGQRLTVELRPRDARSPQSVAASETLAIYVVDRALPTGGLEGVLALAGALRAREAAGARLPGLEPLLFAR